MLKPGYISFCCKKYNRTHVKPSSWTSPIYRSLHNSLIHFRSPLKDAYECWYAIELLAELSCFLASTLLLPNIQPNSAACRPPYFGWQTCNWTPCQTQVHQLFTLDFYCWTPDWRVTNVFYVTTSFQAYGLSCRTHDWILTESRTTLPPALHLLALVAELLSKV